MFEPPVRKKDVYVSRIRTSRNKPVCIRMHNVRFLGIHPLEGNVGFLLKFALPMDSFAVEELKEWDQKAFGSTMDKFARWFPSSAMSTEQIEQCFRSSLTPPCILTALASSVKQPRELQVKNEEVSITRLFGWNRDDLRSMACSLDIEAQGLYFYPKRFGIRWMIRSLRFLDPDTNQHHIEDLTPANKADVESELKGELNETIESIRELRDSYRAKMTELEKLEKEMEEAFAEALVQPSMNKNWNQSLELVRSKITAYQKFLS